MTNVLWLAGKRHDVYSKNAGKDTCVTNIRIGSTVPSYAATGATNRLICAMVVPTQRHKDHTRLLLSRSCTNRGTPRGVPSQSSFHQSPTEASQSRRNVNLNLSVTISILYFEVKSYGI